MIERKYLCVLGTEPTSVHRHTLKGTDERWRANEQVRAGALRTFVGRLDEGWREGKEGLTGKACERLEEAPGLGHISPSAACQPPCSVPRPADTPLTRRSDQHVCGLHLISGQVVGRPQGAAARVRHEVRHCHGTPAPCPSAMRLPWSPEGQPIFERARRNGRLGAGRKRTPSSLPGFPPSSSAISRSLLGGRSPGEPLASSEPAVPVPLPVQLVRVAGLGGPKSHRSPALVQPGSRGPHALPGSATSPPGPSVPGGFSGPHSNGGQ